MALPSQIDQAVHEVNYNPKGLDQFNETARMAYLWNPRTREASKMNILAVWALHKKRREGVISTEQYYEIAEMLGLVIWEKLEDLKWDA